MAETRTGLDAWLGLAGTDYAHELVRQASRVVSELSEQATTGIPRTVNIIRKTVVQAADTALAVAGTWQTVAGLGNLQATMFQPSEWDKDVPATATDIVKADRVFLIADIPAAGGTLADVVLMTDKVQVDDPEFGEVELQILSLFPIRGTGLIKVEAQYVRGA
jgi:hypothetical protein